MDGDRRSRRTPLAAEAEAGGIDPEDELPVEPRADDRPVDGPRRPHGVRRRSRPARPARDHALFRPRVTGAGALIAVLVGLLGFALIAQVQSNSNDHA